ncbi:tRNA epoxyqueuosine(34) reductase QueG [Caballeronia sp. NK8]|uniref:tRNA epoxyqueuosine(34) reductase QueG n=1 Tax=Caballeronia sp. NK8 TaxID=140098 RepID=UPI001BB4960E|nr:tRNA epoxyqueuosine(34) reductase QueG [Caballeronia sp. NK8]BCQ24107.1 tRNA epoxyqueuosine(34) reductase QueG [Caballeronia sp. NK8]
MNRLPEHSVEITTASSDAAAESVSESRVIEFDENALAELAQRIKAWGRELGFGAVGFSDIDLTDAEKGLNDWLEAGYHGEMDYMAKHGMKRARPAELVAGTRRVITARMAYLPARTLAKQGDESVATADGQKNDWRAIEWSRLAKPSQAMVSIYARGRDYHKVMRNRLQQLAERIESEIGPFGHRAFTDSAPVLEVALAQKAGNGWRGKHTLLLDRDAGSLFFLGEIFVDVPLPVDPHPEQDGAHCGQCTRCIGACPTGAIVAPYRVDARRCISYLTIELHGSIPEALRPLIGNRVYGCDDCQLVCPWNKFAQAAPVADFDVRHGLDRATLVDLFAWSADDFDTRMQGSAIRRIGHERWLRNIAVGMGNALRSSALDAGEREAIVDALRAREDDSSELVREHVRWALEQS